jgi:predicted O-methyltransferase YrrM
MSASMPRSVEELLASIERLPRMMAESAITLAPFYERYVTSVSSPDMAVSLETASCLHALCRLCKPASVLDLGSGFSSLAFRHYAREFDPSLVVHSVDDDAAWLMRTASFLESSGIEATGLAHWREFSATAQRGYELVFHDLGRMPMRMASVDAALALLANRGIALLDDVHKPAYAPHARAACGRHGLQLVELRELTLDRYGRFAWLAYRPG